MANEVNIQKMLDSIEKKYLPDALNVIRMAIYEYASDVLADAQIICPIDTTALQASGSVSEVKGEGSKLVVTIGFNTAYAVFVHEVVAQHKPPTQWKFLAVPMQQRAPGFLPWVARRLREAIP